MARTTKALAALAAGALLAAAPAHAQVPEVPGFFASATGLWMFNIGDRFNAGGFSVRPGNGPGFNLMFGYKTDSPWDVALSGGMQWLHFRTSGNAAGQLSTFAMHGNLDLEAGYSMPMGTDTAARAFFGIRGYHYNQNLGAETFAPAAAVGVYRNVWAVGPKIGIAGRTNITENFGLMGQIDGALLLGSFIDNTAGVAQVNYSRVVPQIGGEVGLQYRFGGMPSMALTAGARLDVTFNPAFVNSTTPRGNLVEIGPFIRLSYNLHAPNGAAPPPPAPAPAVSNAYMVFFDFDRSNITPTAATTIKQAADNAKAGNKSRVGVTGHADRSGSDAYNMALSLRRANAVKDELVRDGIPAAAIAVVGRGESQPLVQTPDGVREPQNRRVEIVLQ